MTSKLGDRRARVLVLLTLQERVQLPGDLGFSNLETRVNVGLFYKGEQTNPNRIEANPKEWNRIEWNRNKQTNNGVAQVESKIYTQNYHYCYYYFYHWLWVKFNAK